MHKLKEGSEFKHIAVDIGTYGRIKTLSGDLPYAQYLRALFGELAKDISPVLDDLAGGYSLLPIKRQLDNLGKLMQKLVDAASEALADDKKIAEAIQDNFTRSMSLGTLTALELDKHFPGSAAAIDKQLPGFVASAKEVQGQLRMKESKNNA